MDIANHGLFLLQQLNSQREFGFLCDCTVAIGDVYFKAHKAVLAAFSNYFKMLFIHQTSDCVKLKPADIQPDIFSYLLHLMYTGKIIPQMIDPVRLEQGLKFLHAYPLLQEASLATHGAIPRPDPYFPWPSSLYGIQLARSQACVTVQEQKVHMMAAGLSSHSGPPPQSQPQPQQQPPLQSQPQSQSQPPPRSEQEQNVIEGPIPMSVSVTQGQTHLALQLPLQSTLQQPTQSAQPSCLPYSPGILAQDSTAFPRCYVCHICGRRFSLRSSLREHLYMHTGVPYPQSAVGGRGRSRGSRALCSPGVAACEGRHQASPGQPDREAGTPGGAEGAVDSPPTPGGGEDEEAGDGEGEGDSDGTDGAMFEGYRRVGRTRRFACNVCGRRFTQKSHCKEHMYIHTGKPYSCGICNKTFSRATQAARHVC
uniref:Zinc finger and BTB domain containing 2b n=1 Tax=Petromyzon marinus TaxID=7757 RepID=S4RW15_PETMA